MTNHFLVRKECLYDYKHWISQQMREYEQFIYPRFNAAFGNIPDNVHNVGFANHVTYYIGAYLTIYSLSFFYYNLYIKP